MTRQQIIDTIGAKYLDSNLETGEYSYPRALKGVGKDYKKFLVGHSTKTHQFADIRFESDKLVILVETKDRFTKKNVVDGMGQLQQYRAYEAQLPSPKKTIAILAATETSDVMVWQDDSKPVDKDHIDPVEKTIRPMEEYVNIHFGTRNNKIAVIQSTYDLNKLLHGYGIQPKIRGQFVGTCLLALKHGLTYAGLTTAQIRSGIEAVLENLLNKCLNKAEKIVILKQKVVDDQCIRKLKKEQFSEILDFIRDRILPYINDKTTQGQDLLNLFFTTFNKYVGKDDRNQAFTPDHIVHFMCRVAGVNHNSVVLDPCCGSGAFLVRALTDAIDDCRTEEERVRVKESQIYGIESDETAFGLSTTNMLIHGDGNSNIRQGSCFDLHDWEDKGVNIVLMNPPYNANRPSCKQDYVKTWKKKTDEDPSKGFHFVYDIAHRVKRGRMAVLLPMQCALCSPKEVEIRRYKKLMLEENTLVAVFSLPSEIFYPGASACACCMVFDLGTRHENAQIPETFFGYFKDDGFVKKKKLGRVERRDGLWAEIEKHWLDLFFHRTVEKGFSAVRKVTADDEWLAEAYMETDYSNLAGKDFEQIVRDYYAYIIKNELKNKGNECLASTDDWGEFRFEDLFVSSTGDTDILQNMLEEFGEPVVSAGESNEGIIGRTTIDAKVFSPNTITLDMFGQAFAHGYPYKMVTHARVMSLAVKNHAVSLEVCLFLATIINFNRYKFAYGRMCNWERIKNERLKLPKTPTGEPDWNEMERQIKALPYGDRI